MALAARPPWYRRTAPRDGRHLVGSVPCCAGTLRRWAALLLLLRPAAAQLPYGVTVYPVQSFGFGLPGNSSYPINGAGLNAANATALQLSSGFQCNYIEQQFTEQFTSSTLNLTKWLPTGSVQIPLGQRPTSYGTSNYQTPWGPAQFGAYQNHCPAAGAVGAASPSTCTLMDPGQLALGATLPDGSTGASLSLSQNPCYFANGSNNPYCCSPQSIAKKINGVSTIFVVNVCASWSGTHLSSTFCAQYGVLEVEARYAMPAEGGGACDVAQLLLRRACRL